MKFSIALLMVGFGLGWGASSLRSAPGHTVSSASPAYSSAPTANIVAAERAPESTLEVRGAAAPASGVVARSPSSEAQEPRPEVVALIQPGAAPYVAIPAPEVPGSEDPDARLIGALAVQGLIMGGDPDNL